MPIVNIENQLEIFYETQGSGRPILFIHPPGMGLVTFKKQQPLSHKYQVITFDLRGNGKSGSNHEEITIPLLSNDVLGLMNALSIEKVVVCGYSNGGSIALDFVINNPDRVDGLVLLGGFSEVNTFLLRSEFLLGIYTVRMKGLPVLAKVLGQAHGTNKKYKKEIEEYVLRANPNLLYQIYVKGLKYNCTNRLKEIEVPVLLVDGAIDFYMHSYQKILEQGIQQTKKVFIPKSRHQIPTKHSIELNGLIERFMQKIK